MAGETVITVVGNLTRDPEISFTNSGIPKVSFSIASTPRSFDRASGGFKDGETLFMNCTAWRELAENIAESLSKGMRVVAQGNLEQHHWEDQQTGEKRSRIELSVQEIGPSLRFASAQVSRNPRQGGQGGQGGYGGGQDGGQGGYGQAPQGGQGPQGQQGGQGGYGSGGFNAPAGGTPDDPWSSGQAQPSAFDSPPPF
ncbi:MAG: single-stranded DNA-binding protein [Actinomycetaceae bacterium]|nr:single-stranded DNA-binding protein [Actinomycetaceae bacterium]